MAESITDADALHQLAVFLGKRGGDAQAKKLSAKRRSEIARKAARVRWAKDKEDHGTSDRR